MESSMIGEPIRADSLFYPVSDSDTDYIMLRDRYNIVKNVIFVHI